MLEVSFDPQPLRALRRMPKNQALRIRSKIQQYAENPAALANNTQRLQGRPAYRLRVGHWRVIFSEDGQVMRIIRIAVRGEVYKQ